VGWTCLESSGKGYKTSYRRKNCEEKTFRKTSKMMEGRNEKRFKNENIKNGECE